MKKAILFHGSIVVFSLLVSYDLYAGKKGKEEITISDLSQVVRQLNHNSLEYTSLNEIRKNDEKDETTQRALTLSEQRYYLDIIKELHLVLINKKNDNKITKEEFVTLHSNIILFIRKNIKTSSGLCIHLLNTVFSDIQKVHLENGVESFACNAVFEMIMNIYSLTKDVVFTTRQEFNNALNALQFFNEQAINFFVRYESYEKAIEKVDQLVRRLELSGTDTSRSLLAKINIAGPYPMSTIFKIALLIKKEALLKVIN